MGMPKNFISELADNLSKNTTCKIVFSDPIEKKNYTIINVAKICYGFGGGEALAKGKGGGGGIYAQPVGYIEIKNGRAQFIPIHDPKLLGFIALSLGVGGYCLLSGLAKLFKRG